MDNFDVLYHYTTLGTFEKIVKNGYMAMFDIVKSNDPLEGKFAIKSIKDAYKKIRTYENLSEDRLSNLQRAYHAFLDEVESYGRLQNIICSLSFCIPTHNLLLWRTYGDNGKGIAIGVGKSELEKFNNYANFEFRKVEYKSKDDYSAMAKEMLLCVSKMSKNDALTKIYAFYIDGYFIKELYNSDEEEYRLIFKGIDLTNYTLPSTGEKIDNVEMLVTSNDDMKVFYKLSIQKNAGEINESFLKINNVLIGPNCKSNVQEIRLLLRLHDVNDYSIMQDDISMR